MSKVFAAICCFIAINAYSATLSFVNNSEYDLTVVARGKEGVLLVEMSVPSFQTIAWNYNKSGIYSEGKAGPKVEETEMTFAPYTVTWYCAGSRIFSVCEGVMPGQSVSAESCRGPQWCAPQNK